MLPRLRMVYLIKLTEAWVACLGILHIFLFDLFHSIHIPIPLWVGLGILQNCRHVDYPLPLPIVIKMRPPIKQSNLPECLAEVQQDENTVTFIPLAFMSQNWCNWQIIWMKSVSLGRFKYRNHMYGEFYCTPVRNLLYFSPVSRLISRVLELGQVRLFENNQV